MEFQSLEEVYVYLETDIDSYKIEWELTNAMKRLADQTTDELIKEKIKWECFSFDFSLQNGEVIPKYSSVKEDGTSLFEYPSYTDFGIDGLNYIQERARSVKSNFLIARYNQILWNSSAPHKHQLQAKNAIDAYLKILNILNCISEEKNQGWDCLGLMKNGFSLSVQVKYKIEDYRNLIKTWLFGRGKFPKKLKLFVLQFMLELPQLKKTDFDSCLKLIENVGREKSKEKPDYFFSKDIYEIGLKIAQRVGSDTKIWNKRIGDTIVRMADFRMDDESKMLPLSFLKEAIPYYKLAGLDKKVLEIEQRYFELKEKLKLTKFEIPLNKKDSEELFKYLNEKTTTLLELSSEEIFGYLLTGTDIFPNKSVLQKMAKGRVNDFSDFAMTVKFDINKNISKEKGTKEAKEKSKIYESYDMYMNFCVLPFLHRIFIEGIKQSKITHNNLVRFILKNTWLGQELSTYDSSGDLIKYRWISLIAPSIHEYFLQTESALKSNNPYTTYVMPIDSLTLKFEGVLRDFAKLIKISTTVVGKGNTLREKYIEELLAEKEIQKYFDENDLLLFNYLFVAKDGMNLRNNIAHCFYKNQNYSFQLMHLLICAFLRIGKYKIRIPN